jgi:ATP-dependent RNA helicase RhlB
MRVRDLAWEFMNDPEEIDLEPDHITVESITQELYHVAKSEKFQLLLQLLAQDKPEFALMFTNSKHMAEELCARLRHNGYNADYLTGDLPQNQRQKALDKLKEGKTSILVATDVAARGLQIDDLPLVVNYDIPEDYENYVHRIGRTARAGKSGKAITLADEEFVYGLEAIEKYIKMKIPVIWPDNLPEVEDQSIGKSWRVRPERPQRTQKPNSNKKPQTTTQKEQQKKKPNKSKYSSDRTNTKSLGAMSDKERMDYYRKKYGFEPKKKSQEAPAKKQQKPVKEQPKEVQKEEKPKKIGFFKRLFGRRK